jgi:acyl-CoA dehydrogenase
VPDGAVADAVIAPAGAGLAVVAGGFLREHVATLGMTRSANLSFDGSPATMLELNAVAAVRAARAEGALLFAARQAGMGDWILRQTTDYAAGRVQFGRPIGSFQAIQHKLSEIYIALTAGRHLVRYAASLIESGADAALEVSRAKAFMAAAMWRATVEAHQIHAGVGFILEHPLHLYFAGSRGAESLFGDARRHNRQVGAALLTGDGFRPNALLGA